VEPGFRLPNVGNGLEYHPMLGREHRNPCRVRVQQLTGGAGAMQVVIQQPPYI
jgi:hypothetical protein